MKLIFDMRLNDQLPDVLLQEFFIHSTSGIYLRIWNNFSVLISKAIDNLLWDIYKLANLFL